MQRRGQALSTQILVVILCPILPGEGRITAAYVSWTHSVSLVCCWKQYIWHVMASDGMSYLFCSGLRSGQGSAGPAHPFCVVLSVAAQLGASGSSKVTLSQFSRGDAAHQWEAQLKLWFLELWSWVAWTSVQCDGGLPEWASQGHHGNLGSRFPFFFGVAFNDLA